MKITVRRKNDYYPTPGKAVLSLIKHCPSLADERQALEPCCGDWQQELFLELNALDMRIAALKKAQTEEVNYRAGYKTGKDPEAGGRGTEGH